MSYDNYGGDREVPVCGTIACVLRLTRVVGLAPLRFHARRGRTYARISRPHVIYGYIVMIIIGCISSLKIFLLLEDKNNKILPLRTLVAEIIIISTMIIIMFGIYNSPNRMKRVQYYIQTIEQVKTNVSYGKSKERYDKMRIAVTMLCLTWLFVIIIYNAYQTKAKGGGGNSIKVAIIIMQSMAHFILRGILMQQIFLMYEVANALRSINEDLARMHHHISRSFLLSNMVSEAQRDVIEENSRSYVAMCRVARDINKHEGPMLMVLLVYTFVYIVYVNFNSFTYAAVAAMDYKAVFFIGSYIFHNMEFIFFVDPGHQILGEESRTRVLLSRIQYIRGLGEASEVMYKHLMLNSLAISPLDMLPLDRPVIVSMISVAATSMATILQFRKTS